MKKFIFSLFFLFFSCDNYHEKSFNQLNNAFEDWYVKSIENNIIHNDNSEVYFFYYTQISVNDLLEDLKRFKLELSQINYQKLSKENKNFYNLLDNKIKHLIFEYYYLKRYENDPSLYIDDIINKLEVVHNLYNHSNYDKLILINEILDEAKFFLDESKFVLKNYFNLENCINKKDVLVSYLSFLLIDIKDVSYENEIESNRTLIKADNLIQSYINWIKLNLSTKQDFSRLELYDYYFDTYLRSQKSYNHIMENLVEDINKHYKSLFNVSLSLYLKENDEPVWVDNDDSLQVIRWAINDARSKYDPSKYLRYSNIAFDTLNASYIDSSLYMVENDFIYQGEEESSLYALDNLYVKYNLHDFFDNKVINNQLSMYLNEYYQNAFLTNLQDHINKNFINQKDLNFEVLFYLNLYKRFNQIYYHEIFLKGDKTLKDIKKHINDNSIFNDPEKKYIYNKIDTDYYLLYEYILYSKLNEAFINDAKLYNQESLVKLLNENLYSN